MKIVTSMYVVDYSSCHNIPCDSMYVCMNEQANRASAAPDIAWIMIGFLHAPLQTRSLSWLCHFLSVKLLVMTHSGNIQVPKNDTDQPGTIPCVIPSIHTAPKYQYYSERKLHTCKIVQAQGKA